MPGIESLAGPVGIASSALGIVAGVGQYIGAARDLKKAREERSRLKQPFYKIQDEYLQNRNLAASEAQGGIPAATKDYLQTESERGLGTAMQGISQSGGSPNNYADLFDSYNRSIKQTAAQDASAQIENINRFMTVNKDLAGQKTTQWAINEYQPYQNKLKEVTERIKAAKLNKSSAIQGAIGSLGATGTALSNEGLLKKLFPQTQDQEAGPLPSSFQEMQERAIGQKVQLPTSSPSTQSFRPNISGWAQQQESDYISSILGQMTA
jgi:hypothetical protein